MSARNLPSVDGEAHLVGQARGGSQEAFTRLLRLHQARVRTYLRRFVRSWDTVDDLAQESFLAAYRDLSSYGGGVPLVEWLLGIARNKALMHLRQEERRRVREGRKVDAILSGWLAQHVESEAPGTVTHAEEISALQHCIQGLPERSARLVQEYYFMGRRGAQVARDMATGEGALWVTLMRVRRALRQCVEARLATKGASP